MNRSKKTIRFLKTTANGGLLLLVLLIGIGALMGEVVPIVLTVTVIS
jgi:hypothetical protein